MPAMTDPMDALIDFRRAIAQREVRVEPADVHADVFVHVDRQRAVMIGRQQAALRRSRAALAEPIDRDAHLARLVGEIVLDAGAGEDDDADW